MLKKDNHYHVIVVGGGHAGCEAALASARMGVKTLLVTINLDTIGHMACAPAVGGVGKGHIVREIDALGGEIGYITDLSALQYKTLNTSKGLAVQATRAQVDKVKYRKLMLNILENQENLDIRQNLVSELILDKGKIAGVKDFFGFSYFAGHIILAAGTFLNGLIHIGSKTFPAGRAGEFSSNQLAEQLIELGFEMFRFKTGTGPRLKKSSIDFKKLEVKPGDGARKQFSHRFAAGEDFKEYPCHLTYTNAKTHKIILDNLSKSALYGGRINATSVRYCPSLEDKVYKFKDKERHQVILEPEGINTEEIYVSGLGNSMPPDIQLEILHSVKGLENAVVMRPAYAIEYDGIVPLQLKNTLESKLIKGLYFSGQVNGTTGYEEAAGQGFIAGVNAALSVKGKEPFILDRSEAYLGVLIDDLVTKGTDEPYRIFTSRAEYRLVLREDNIDLRLAGRGFELGLISGEIIKRVEEKQNKIDDGILFLKNTKVPPSDEVNKILAGFGTAGIDEPAALETLLKRPEMTFERLLMICRFDPPYEMIKRCIEINVKYSGYIERQKGQISQFKRIEKMKIPEDFKYDHISGLSNEVLEKLNKIRPVSVGQAGRIPGVTPAAVSAIMIHLKKEQRKITDCF